jgi:hypothetical protein
MEPASEFLDDLADRLALAEISKIQTCVRHLPPAFGFDRRFHKNPSPRASGLGKSITFFRKCIQKIIPFEINDFQRLPGFDLLSKSVFKKLLDSLNTPASLRNGQAANPQKYPGGDPCPRFNRQAGQLQAGA